MSPVRRPRVAYTTVAAAFACCLVLAGCSGSPDSRPRPTAQPSEASAEATPLEDVDTTGLVVTRGPFCHRIDPAAVTRALGEEPADVSAYRSGQRIKISDDVADVVHEFGCRWTAGNGTAEAWVFAPPVTPRRAAALARDRAGLSECVDFTGPDFGRPSASCGSSSDDAEQLSYRGLFGDAWLTCSLTLAKPTQAKLNERASQWCAAVATGAATPGG